MDGTDVAVGRRGWTRRAAWVGLAGAAAAAASLAWLRSRRDTPDPRAVELYRRGQAIQKDGMPETMGEAIEAYKQAVAIDPGYADAWGALALSYRYPVVGPIARLGDPQEVRAAAKRALALDPGNADARLALITLYPSYRRWQECEAQLRAFLRDHPDSAPGHIRLGWLLLNVGRIEDAVAMAQGAIDIDATQQMAWLELANAYYYAGRDDEGDVAIEEARSRWPQAWRLYINGFYFLVFSKRYVEAVAYLRDTRRRPRVVRRETVEGWIREAEAFASGRGLAELRNKVSPVAQPVSVQIQAPHFAAPCLALLGMVDEMFAFFEAYFFGGVVNGTRVAPPGPLDPRGSFALFAPAVLSLRNDPRYASLLARTGLEDYWHKTGTQPDFRRR
jgi:Tfp pilus assembly protein PilF